MEHITLDQVYNLSTINFLTDLAYLKDRGREEKRQMKKWQAKHNGRNSS